MRKQVSIKASFLVIILSCFAAFVSYCQETIQSYSNCRQGSLNAFFYYLPDAKGLAIEIANLKNGTGEMISAPYLLLSDSLAKLAVKSDAALGYMIISNNDVVNLNDSISFMSNDADSLDSKEANANSITVQPQAPTKDANSNDGENLPAELSGKKIDHLINKFAEMISIEPEDVKNYPLYKFINDWYGVKYKWGGVDNTGIDCSAFSQKLYGQIYSTNIQRTARQQHKTSEKIKDYGEANEGDLVFFRIHHIRITHVGVYLANGYFVHASRSHGVVISNLDDHYWRSRYAGCGRVAKQDRAATESDFVQ